ncbi:MAG TPA: iron transporter [Halococcus sp.]|nr:iron transporter [Halococcus sp.]
MDRRAFLRAGIGSVVAGSGALAGCSSLFNVQYGQRLPPVPENRPSGVYYPSHIEGMDMVGMSGMTGMNATTSHTNHSGNGQTTDDSRYVCALMYSYPHRFWTVTGNRTNKVAIQDGDSIHLMVSVWDRKTGVYFMDTTPAVTISQNGETVTTVRPWTMLTQNMGFHAGDNVALPGGGTYSVTVDVPPTAARRTGAFDGQFTTKQSFEFEFEYSNQKRNDITFEILEKKAGKRGAVEPMTMKQMPLAFAPKQSELPGRILGTKTSGDGEFVVTAIENASRFGADGKTYLAVSPRTPYNRYILPSMSLSARVVRNDKTVFDGPLTTTLDPELNYHYGTVVERIDSGDELELIIDAPPQVARHEGYETAFLEMPQRTIRIE